MTCPLVLDVNALISLFDGSDDDLEQALCRRTLLEQGATARFAEDVKI